MNKSFYKTIFENQDFIIIEKFGGISFEGEDGLLRKLREDHPEIYGIHRLDKDTSGLMIFAKSKIVQSEISILFQEKKITKYYFAISEQRPKKKMGAIKGDLVKSRGGNYKLSKTMINPSHTKFKSFFHEVCGLRGFLLRPYTGQTHQLRVHLKSIGSPILGDVRYATSEAYDRMYLAAIYLKFSYGEEDFEFFKYPEAGKLYIEFNYDKPIRIMIQDFGI